MTEKDQAALHTEFTRRLKEAVDRRDAELAGHTNGYSAALAAQTPDIAAVHTRYAIDHAAAAVRHAEIISKIQDHYAQEARFGAPPLPTVAPPRPGYPAPVVQLIGSGRRGTATTNSGKSRLYRSAKATPFQQKPTPIWRLAAGSIVAVIAVASAVVAFAVIATGTSQPPRSTAASSESSNASASSAREVVYEVEGTAKAVDITYETPSGTAQQSGLKVPLSRNGGSERGITLTMSRGDFVYISAQNKGPSGAVTCKISVDGVVISKVTSTGGYTIAQCSSTAF
jgi:Mycobacterium membrane protein